MDFVVSKVVMSICALLTASALAGALGGMGSELSSHELTSIVDDLCGLIDCIGAGNAPGAIQWPVPSSARAGELSVEVTGSLIRASLEGRSEVARPSLGIHTWAWCGEPLNETIVSERDAASEAVVATSGMTIEIASKMVMFENSPVLMLFARAWH